MSKILESLRLCKGYSKNSMLSLIVPSYNSIPGIVSYLESYKKKLVSDLFITGLIDEDDKKESKNIEILYDECNGFLTGLEWKESDKKEIGLLLYFGYIDNGGEEKKRVYHTFPIEIDKHDFRFRCLERFDLSLLNHCKWFTDVFGII